MDFTFIGRNCEWSGEETRNLISPIFLREPELKTSSRLSCEQVTKAFPSAKATSPGLSPVGKVSVPIPLESETTEIESESSFTTRASSEVLSRIETGTEPT